MKNIHLFRFLKPVTISSTDLQERLSKSPWTPCNKMDMESVGWVPPLDDDSKSLVHTVNNCFFFCLRKEVKILPSSVIREYVNEKIKEVEKRIMRKVRKREKKEIRDEVLQFLVSHAFPPRSTYVYAYIDVTQGWLLIDTPALAKAEEFVGFLRKTLGSLPIVPPEGHLIGK